MSVQVGNRIDAALQWTLRTSGTPGTIRFPELPPELVVLRDPPSRLGDLQIVEAAVADHAIIRTGSQSRASPWRASKVNCQLQVP